MNDSQQAVSVLALNPSVDISHQIAQLLEFQKVRAQQTWYHPGGNGINITRALTELGVPARCRSIIGGKSGDLFLSLLGDSLGEDHKWFSVSGETRINTTIVQQSPPCQYEVASTGPEISSERLAQVCDDLLNAAGDGITVFSGLLPPGAPTDTYRTLIDRVNAQGGRAVFEAQGDVLEQGLEAKPWLLRLNHYLLEMIMKRRMEGTQLIAEAGRSLQQKGVSFVCISLGDKGAILLDGNNSYYCEAPKVHRRSTVGCGDALLGGLIAAARSGEDCQQMLRFGVICGSATATHPGTELFTRDEVEGAWKEITVSQLDI